MRRLLGPDTSMALLRRARRLSRRLSPQLDRGLREAAKLVLNYRGARDGGLRAMHFRRLARHTDLVAAPFGEGTLLVDAHDDEVARTVYVTGGYERLYMQVAVEFLASAGHPVDGRAFLDVGANIGTSSVDALLHFGFRRAMCFEPEAQNVRLLALNMKLNGLDDRVQIHPFALSDQDGEGAVARSALNSGDHRIAVHPGPAADIQPVALRRLDSLVADGTVVLDDVGLVWMDVQGHEPFVLRGATSVTEAGMPLVLEYLPDDMAAAGTLAAYERLVMEHYATVIDLHQLAHGCSGSSFPARDLPALAREYRGGAHTDLLLLR